MVTRLSGGITPADGSDPRTFPTIWNATADTIESQGTAITAAESDIDDLEAKNIPSFGTATPSDGQVLTFDSATSEYVPEDSAAFPSNAYAYVDTVYFTSNGTFTKATYPWLRAICVKVQGAGGGGAGAAATSSGQVSGGGAGGGGGYGEKFVTDIAGLSASETVTVGTGGTGGTGGSGGNTGGSSSAFGVTATGGGGGGVGTVSAPSAAFGNGGSGGSATGEDFLVGGSGGNSFFAQSTSRGYVGSGGGCFLGRNDRPNYTIRSGSVAGFAGDDYGCGGSTAFNTPSDATNRTGGTGGEGIVIVELYA